jgi:hypothetical protein
MQPSLLWKSSKYYVLCVCVWGGGGLIIQHAERMRRVTLSSVACVAVQYLSTLSHRRHNFRKKKKLTDPKMCVLISSTIFF